MSSLDALTNVLVQKEIAENDPNICKHLSTEFRGELLKKKGILWIYINSFERLNNTALPPYEMFYNRSTNGNIKQEEYEHAKNVWNTFNMKTFGDSVIYFGKLM